VRSRAECSSGQYLLESRDAENETDGIEDVGLAGAVQACNGIEHGVEAVDDRALGI